MNALDLVHELTAHGVRVEVHGNRLSLEGPPEVLTDELAERLRRHKPELLSLYSRRVHSIPLAELRDLSGDDWLLMEADPELLEAFAHAVRTRRMRERGEVPPEYTNIAECAGCGSVPLWKGSPSRVLACPWCFNRLRGQPVPTMRGARHEKVR